MPLHAPVLIDLESSWEKAECRDVSPVGLAVEVSHPLPLGASVELYFELPTWTAVEVTATVVRNEAGIAGLRFVTLDPMAARALVTYCDDTERGEMATGIVRRLTPPGDVQLS
ncbi:MAG: PilZ domain-containing protein [Polyangiaceae bacterium]|nr:PilZ domain-containing protein [Polyangiaceae bacterium]